MIWFVVIGDVFGVPGALAYAGCWRSWTRSRCPVQLFAMFWLGMALVCAGIGASLLDGPLVGVSLALVSAFVLSVALGLEMVLDGARWATPGSYRRAVRR